MLNQFEPAKNEIVKSKYPSKECKECNEHLECNLLNFAKLSTKVINEIRYTYLKNVCRKCNAKKHKYIVKLPKDVQYRRNALLYYNKNRDLVNWKKRRRVLWKRLDKMFQKRINQE